MLPSHIPLLLLCGNTTKFCGVGQLGISIPFRKKENSTRDYPILGKYVSYFCRSYPYKNRPAHVVAAIVDFQLTYTTFLLIL